MGEEKTVVEAAAGSGLELLGGSIKARGLSCHSLLRGTEGGGLSGGRGGFGEEEDFEGVADVDFEIGVREGGFGAGRSGGDGEVVSDVTNEDGIGPTMDEVSTLVVDGVMFREEEGEWQL